ncbi:MAG: hypothetical protein HYY50_03960 [Candidatus Kerfeldbacteria bacterium]|nr:hypothetical protein [Candidatus Kerfeldbacteria bacterium]
MSLAKFLIILGAGTIMSWTAWWLVLTTLNPFTNGAVAPALFYLSLWLALLGTITLLGFFVRYWLDREKVLFRQVEIALREAIILSSGTILALLLQAARLLRWWTAVVLALLVLMVEFFYLATDSRRIRNP